jgi:hypothetical protein
MRFERTQGQIVAVETQKIEGQQRGHEPAVLGQERVEVASTVITEDDRFDIDQRIVRRKAANRFGDPLPSDREVRSAAAACASPNLRFRNITSKE